MASPILIFIESLNESHLTRYGSSNEIRDMAYFELETTQKRFVDAQAQ
jgi:hypothetical protein